MRSTQQTASPDHPPLARDNRGQLVPVPDGTVAWRISRHTGGRPRVIHGPDKQPARFPLETTPEELLDMCGPDTYRIHALDEVGQVIDHVTNLDVGLELRNAAGPEVLGVFAEPHAPAANSNADAGSSSGAMPRAMEMLTHALVQIAKTNGEALRVVAESQADWIKSIAQAKGGLLKNVGLPEWFVRDRLNERRRERDDDDDDEDGDDGDEVATAAAPAPSAPQSGVEAFLGAVAPMLPSLMADWRGKNRGPVDVVPAPTDTRLVLRQLAKVRRLLTADERMLLDHVLENDPLGDAIAADLAGKPVEEVVTLIRAKAAGHRTVVESPPPPRVDAGAAVQRAMEQLGTKAAQALKHVEAPLRLRLMALAVKLRSVKTLTPEIVAMIDEVEPLNVEQTASWLREHIDDLEKRFS